MKTKLTFLTLAIVALLGVGMLMAFKQEEKKHSLLTVDVYQNWQMLQGNITITNENGATEIIDIGKWSNNPEKQALTYQKINQLLNKLISTGYKLKFTIGGDYKTQYIFEKE